MNKKFLLLIILAAPLLRADVLVIETDVWWITSIDKAWSLYTEEDSLSAYSSDTQSHSSNGSQSDQ